MDEDYIAITKKEYDFFLSCRQKLIEMHEAEIQKCYNEMQTEIIKSLLNNPIV